ncbi:MAG TPA: hypothetical protein VII47_06370 [Actinomycetota bacterium]|jgi:hypothetical protein
MTASDPLIHELVCAVDRFAAAPLVVRGGPRDGQLLPGLEGWELQPPQIEGERAVWLLTRGEDMMRLTVDVGKLMAHFSEYDDPIGEASTAIVLRMEELIAQFNPAQPSTFEAAIR